MSSLVPGSRLVEHSKSGRAGQMAAGSPRQHRPTGVVCWNICQPGSQSAGQLACLAAYVCGWVCVTRQGEK